MRLARLLQVLQGGRWLAVLLLTAASVPARAQTGTNAWPVPRHAAFKLDAQASEVTFSMFAGGAQSRLAGMVWLYLGDPSVPVPLSPIAGWVGLSVDGADMITLDPLENPALPKSLHMIQDPAVRSTGLWNMMTGSIQFQLHLTTPEGPLPVPQPLNMAGYLALYSDSAGLPVLSVKGDNGPVCDAYMTLTIKAYEIPVPPPPVDMWFSTEVGFASGSLRCVVSDGDLLSRSGVIVRRNSELSARLGIMPPVPPLGLDAVAIGPRGTIWFSFKETVGPVWSEALRTWLKHGDLLSDAGLVVRTNEQLLAKFIRMPPVADVGLDAVARAPNGALLFSVNTDFFCESLNTTVKHGDLLSDRGVIVMTNKDLLRNFQIIDLTGSPVARDYGLDAVIVRSNAEIWFSTEVGFQDGHFGWISDGDLLSTRGYVVARNLELLSAFAPIEDIVNFGLDAAALPLPVITADLDMDGDVDQSDFGLLQAGITGPASNADMTSPADLDGDGHVDLNDLAVFQRCFSGAAAAPLAEGCQ